MTTDEIREKLFALQDTNYRALQLKLIPTADEKTVIGVRTPELRRLAKELIGERGTEAFLRELPHRYFDENQLHAFIISELKEYPTCLELTECFLPYIDNWATCDQLSPKVFRKHRPEVLTHIQDWLYSGRTYTVRFGLGMLMEHFMDKDFDPEYLDLAAAVRSDEYYVNMMIAWYFATALAKQYNAALPFIEERCLDPRAHNRAIQKATESRRITPERKEYLKTLRIR